MTSGTSISTPKGIDSIRPYTKEPANAPLKSYTLIYNYVTLLEKPHADARLALHQDILRGDAPSPYNYRVLVPLLTESAARALCSYELITYRQAWILAYAAYDFLSIALFLTTLYFFLQEWHSSIASLAGVFLCAALLPLSLRDHYFQPWSLLETWLFCAALVATYRRRFGYLVAITIIASLNRETGIFIPFIYLFGTIEIKPVLNHRNKDVMRTVARFIGLLALSVLIAFALRFVQGSKEQIHTIGELWNRNTSSKQLLIASIHVILFLGAGWVLMIRGIRCGDRFLRQELLLAPLYLLPVLIFGAWKEVRLLMPLYPLFVSLLLFSVREELIQQTDTIDNQWMLGTKNH